MNWKDVPHLFTNGKFGGIVSLMDRDIRSVITGFKYPNTFYLSEQVEFTTNLQSCTLIARPISDMSDQEMIESGIWDSKSHDELYEEKIISSEYVDQIAVKEFMLYLAIGVYPFDQAHFEDGTVININDL